MTRRHPLIAEIAGSMFWGLIAALFAVGLVLSFGFILDAP